MPEKTKRVDLSNETIENLDDSLRSVLDAGGSPIRVVIKQIDVDGDAIIESEWTSPGLWIAEMVYRVPL